jgi:UDP-N-acetyl-D-mannosaminuronic acid dehydrogenase
MPIKLDDLAAVLAPADTVEDAIKILSRVSTRVRFPGLGVITDRTHRLKGLVTDGDIRRALAALIPLSTCIGDIIVSNPISILDSVPKARIQDELTRKIASATHIKAETVRYVPIIDSVGVVVDIIDPANLPNNDGNQLVSVTVIGLGFVGLTVATALSNIGYHVQGLDSNSDLVRRLRLADPHIFEPGLSEMIARSLERETLVISHPDQRQKTKHYLVCVGTPVTTDGEPSYSDIVSACRIVAADLSLQDNVMIRSTLPVGSTRAYLQPILEQASGLTAGTDFSLSFVPERTLAGSALQELRSLPQLIGGISPSCSEAASIFWAPLTSTTIKLDSVESAEIAKLANNSFRDLCFAFANELAFVADTFNVNAFDLIQRTNQGYPRNPIAQPSPGVGGYCLTKDPLLFANSRVAISNRPTLGIAARHANEKAERYPITQLKRFCSKTDLCLERLKVIVVGIAFKGNPETNDTRGSCGLTVARALHDEGVNVYISDFVIESDVIQEFEIPYFDLETSPSDDVDAFLFMNNHVENQNVLSRAWLNQTRPRFIFDGWHQLDRAELESFSGITYSTMGYITESEEF